MFHSFFIPGIHIFLPNFKARRECALCNPNDGIPNFIKKVLRTGGQDEKQYTKRNLTNGLHSNMIIIMQSCI
jgi:hypothetical protein